MRNKYLYLAVLSLAFLCYQNFSALSAEDLRTLETIKEMNRLQSENHVALLAPQSGHDLESVRNDWLQKQSSVWLDGADQRLLDSMNQRVSEWFNSNFKSSEPEAVVEEETSSGGGRAPASIDKQVQAFKFSRVNSMEYKIDENSLVTCSIQGDGAHLDYTTHLSANTHLGVTHRTADSQTQVLLKYNW